MQSAHNSNPLRKTLPVDPFHRWEDCAITGEVTAKSHSRPGASAASYTLSCLSTLCRGPSFLVWEASVEYRQELSLSKVLGYGDELFSFFCLPVASCLFVPESLGSYLEDDGATTEKLMLSVDTSLSEVELGRELNRLPKKASPEPESFWGEALKEVACESYRFTQSLHCWGHLVAGPQGHRAHSHLATFPCWALFPAYSSLLWLSVTSLLWNLNALIGCANQFCI